MKVQQGTDYKKFKKLDKELSKLKSAKIKVGILSDENTESNLETIIEYAISNEFGNPEKNTPSRPFFRSATEWGKSKKEIDSYVRSTITDVIMGYGSYSADQALNKIGEYVRGRVVKSIRNGNWKPNAPATIEAKGDKPPLIDSGDMIKSIAFEVIK